MQFVMLCVLLLMGSYSTQGARILGLFPLPSKSHMAVNAILVKELAKRGHQVTVLSPFPEKSPIPNYTNIDTGGSMEKILEDTGNQNTFNLREMSWVHTSMFLWEVGDKLCRNTLEEEHVQKLIHSTEEHYDLIITEGFCTDCFLGFAHKFKAPIVQIISFGGSAWIDDWVGNPSPYAYVPDMLIGFSDRMNFYERMINTIGITYQKITRELYFLPKQQEILEKYFSEYSPLPTISQLIQSTSLMLLNNHFSISYPRPLLPNMVQVGGMHVQPPKKLPADLQKFIDESPDGVIYFSMGSALKSQDMSEDIRMIFLDTFSKLKQRILWKWEADTLPGKPDNVKVGKWLPQSDILAHPNVRLFITHGGLLSTQETIHRGVPVIGIPIMADQKLNMAKTVSAGLGIQLDYENITANFLRWALEEVLGNPRYREKAKQLSQLFRDQPLSPLEQAVFWTEYVIRHKGAPHMRSAALDLTWYQYFLLDVIAVLTLAAISIILVLFFIFKLILRKLCGEKKANKSKKKPD